MWRGSTNLGICKEPDGIHATDNTVEYTRRMAAAPPLPDLATKTPQSNTVEPGADGNVSHSPTKDANTTRPSGLLAEIEVEAVQLQERKGKSR
jgi:hypothetical protein